MVPRFLLPCKAMGQNQRNTQFLLGRASAWSPVPEYLSLGFYPDRINEYLFSVLTVFYGGNVFIEIISLQPKCPMRICIALRKKENENGAWGEWEETLSNQLIFPFT